MLSKRLVILLLIIAVCCIVFVVGSDKDSLGKCQASCNRRFAKHQIDQRGKQRCYERCGDDPNFFDSLDKNSLVFGAENKSARRHVSSSGRSLSSIRAEDKGEASPAKKKKKKKEQQRCCRRPELRAGNNSECQRRSSGGGGKRAGKNRARNSREVSSRIFKSADGDFRLREIYGDGNCLFRAISFVLWGTETRHRYLRSLVVQHIETTWRELRPYVLAEWNISTASAYMSFMGADGAFASELECLVATRLNRLNLAIYRRADAAGNLRCILHSRVSRRAKTANLLFSGRNEYGHYDVLLPVAS